MLGVSAWAEPASPIQESESSAAAAAHAGEISEQRVGSPDSFVVFDSERLQRVPQTLESLGISFEALHIFDWAMPFSGGVEKRDAARGRFDGVLSFELERILGLKGGTAGFNGVFEQQIWSRRPISVLRPSVDGRNFRRSLALAADVRRQTRVRS